jgi:hypothetical protein
MTYNLTDYEENRLLDLSLLNTDKLRLLSAAATESTTGTALSGGSYADQTLTFAAASGGSKATSAAQSYTNLVAGDIQGWSIVDSAGTNTKWYGLWNPQSGTAQATGDTVTLASHGLTNGQKIVFQAGYAPAGLTANTTYFVVGATTNTFQVAATSGGAAIDITSDAALVQWGKVKTIATTGDGFTVPSGGITCSFD